MRDRSNERWESGARWPVRALPQDSNMGGGEKDGLATLRRIVELAERQRAAGGPMPPPAVILTG